MGVLPEASNELVPKPYRVRRPVDISCHSIDPLQWLMANADSPIIEFYPQEFTQDMNGKKQEWEAVVKIPFIDEKRLLSAMACKFVVPSSPSVLTKNSLRITTRRR